VGVNWLSAVGCRLSGVRNRESGIGNRDVMAILPTSDI
jgi:hypothetical protein